MKKWFERWADRLAAKGRRRMIRRERDGNNEDYLERFYIISTSWLGIYLHRFWASDDDGLHDHPWNSVSILLSGSYYEEEPERQTTPYGPTITRLRRPLHPPFKIRSRYAAHRITVNKENPGAWSLFIRFGFKRRKWGFYRQRGWEPAEVQSRKEENEITENDRMWRAIARGCVEAKETGEMIIVDSIDNI
jgi:hypothetical protein